MCAYAQSLCFSYKEIKLQNVQKNVQNKFQKWNLKIFVVVCLCAYISVTKYNQFKLSFQPVTRDNTGTACKCVQGTKWN